LEGQASARPQNFGTEKAAPSELSPNEFGAQKVRHQPLAEASGMGDFRTLSSQVLILLERCDKKLCGKLAPFVRRLGA